MKEDKMSTYNLNYLIENFILNIYSEWVKNI